MVSCALFRCCTRLATRIPWTGAFLFCFHAAALLLGCFVGLYLGSPHVTQYLRVGDAVQAGFFTNHPVIKSLEAVTDPVELARLLRSERTIRLIHQDKSRMARLLARRIHVACAVGLNGQDVQPRAWTRRCNRLFLPKPTSNSFVNLLRMTSLSETKALQTTLGSLGDLDGSDWFLFARAKSYVIIENLRYLVRYLDPSSPLLLGHMTYSGRRLKLGNRFAFAFSRGAVRRIVLGNCSKRMLIHVCASSVGIKFVDSRDRVGCQRFFPGRLESAFESSSSDGWTTPCLSESAIAINEPWDGAEALLEFGSRLMRAYGVAGYVNVTDAYTVRNDSAPPTWSPDIVDILNNMSAPKKLNGT